MSFLMNDNLLKCSISERMAYSSDGCHKYPLGVGAIFGLEHMIS